LTPWFIHLNYFTWFKNVHITRIKDHSIFNVVHGGAMVTQDGLIKEALELAARAILIPTSSGNGEIDCEGLCDECVEAGLKDILL
jgi:methylmalonyl-CoA mutase cobalamin-binding subunit